MKSAIQLLVLATGALFALTACTSMPSGPDWDLDTGDTGWSDDPVDPLIAQVTFSCNPGNPDMWSYYSRMDGWAGLATLDVFETGDGNWPNNPGAVWVESHNLNNTDHDPEGTWDEWSLSLRHVTTISQQYSGSTTLFGCEWNDGRSLAFREAIYDESMRELDCVIWGHESQQYFNGYRGDSCVCIDPDGSCNN